MGSKCHERRGLPRTVFAMLALGASALLAAPLRGADPTTIRPPDVAQTPAPDGPRVSRGGRVMPDPRFLSGELRAELPADELLAEIDDYSTSSTLRGQWVMRVWLETMRGLEEQQRWSSFEADHGTSETLARLTALVPSQLATEYVEALAPDPGEKFPTAAAAYSAAFQILEGPSNDPTIQTFVKIDGRLSDVEHERDDWRRVLEDPRYLTVGEREKLLARWERDVQDSEYDDEMAEDSIQELQLQRSQTLEELADYETQRDRQATTVRVNPASLKAAEAEAEAEYANAEEDPAAPAEEETAQDRLAREAEEAGADQAKVDRLLELLDAVAEARITLAETEAELRQEELKREQISARLVEIRGKIDRPVRDIPPGGEQEVLALATRRLEELGREAKDLSDARETLRAEYQDRLTYWSESLERMEPAMRQDMAAVGPALRSMVDHIEKWPEFAEAKSRQEKALNRLRQAIGDMNIPVTP